MDIFGFFGIYEGNLDAIKSKLDSFFITGVCLPTKKVKEILQHQYDKHGLVRKKATASDLSKIWEIPTETKLIRDKRHNNEVIQFTRVL